jgi:1-deoxy-D-xylulose-5-phosphate reductoisomerase
MRRIGLSILGATGSIGGSAASLVGAFPGLFEVRALAAGRNVAALAGLVGRFAPDYVSVLSEAERGALLAALRGAGARRVPELGIGEEGLRLAATHPGADTVLSAISGAAGLIPTFAALSAGKRVALANKESLVMAGGLLGPAERALLTPVDSEHSAIFQALGGTLDGSKARRLVLTASGGPFRGCGPERLGAVTPQEALRHPNWSMGRRISIDSATLFNKGLEVIEARHLFGVPFERISVLVHPQSVIHSLVEFPDGSLIAQMGVSDMRVPIAYALGFPERLPLLGNPALGDLPPFAFDRDLTFEEPDVALFPALPLAIGAGREGGTAPSVLNAADEVAVGAFLDGGIPFPAIPRIIEDCLQGIPSRPLTCVGDALEADREARGYARSLLGKYGPP